MTPERARSFLQERAGRELVERLEHLDRVRGKPRTDVSLPPPDAEARLDTDVVFAGGGLSLLVAAELARLGVKVTVVERARAGAAHREWNASDPELVPLVRSGIVTAEELEGLVVGRYRDGICAFHGGTPRHVQGVLDRAVDAGPLLAKVREVAEARGVKFVDEAQVSGVGAGRSAVRVSWSPARQGKEQLLTRRSSELVARILVDARGASSPWATADLMCPTVGGTMRGFRQGTDPRAVDPTIGDILVTTEDAVFGRQHVWEGFPGKPGETTVYLFYYARASDVKAGALTSLYARFFETLASYKDGDADMVRPTFGFIPGWSRLSPAPEARPARVVLVGDAAARHSPLTFCGFGSMLRTFEPVARALARAVEQDEAPPREVIPEEAVHAWTGGLAQVMASRVLEGDKQNVLLDAAFGVLEGMGNVAFADLLQDRMTGHDFTEFLRRTSKLRPVVYGDVLRALGPLSAMRWGTRLARHVLS